MIAIKKDEDILKIRNKRHENLIGADYYMFYSDAFYQSFTPEEIVDHYGFQVYFEDYEELYKEDPEIGIIASEGYIEYLGAIQWETVTFIEGLYRVIILLNDEAGLVYYIPEEIVRGTHLEKLLRSYL
jgi:hypothetical protein